MSGNSVRELQFRNEIGPDATAQLKRLKKRLRTRRIAGYTIGLVLYFVGVLGLLFAFEAPGQPPVSRWLIGIFGAATLSGCLRFILIAAAPLIDVEDKLAARLEAFYLYLPQNTPFSTELTWRLVANARLSELADLIWLLPSHLNTTDPAVVREANRIAGGLLAKQKRVSFEGSVVMQEELEKWSIHAMERFLKGDWQSIDDYAGDPVEPPKISKGVQRRLITVGSAVMAFGLAVISAAALVGGAAAGTVAVVAAAPIFLVARHVFTRAGVSLDGLKESQDLATGFLPTASDQPKSSTGA